MSRRRGRLAAAALLVAGCAPGGDRDLELHRARNAVAEGRHDWARLHFRHDAERNPSRVESLRDEAFAWLSGYQRSLSEARARLELYLAARPGDVEARQRLVDSLLLLGEGERAREWAAGLDETPRSRRLRAAAELDRDAAAALALLRPALTADPGDAAAWALAARAHERLGEDEAALAAADRTLAIDPLDYETHYLRLRRLQAAGDGAAAAAAAAAFDLARRLQHDGTLAPLSPAAELAALRALQPAVAADGYRFRRRLALALLANGELAAAADEIAWLAAQPEATVTHLLEYAVAADRAGLRALARRLFEAVLAAEPDNPGARSSLALMRLEAGDLAGARELLARGLAADPHFARYHHLAGRLAAAEERHEEALARYRTAVDLAPWQSAWRLALAEQLALAGRAAEALAALDEAPEPAAELTALRRRLAAPAT